MSVTTALSATLAPLQAHARTGPARLGFAGAGWIGRSRMLAMIDSGSAVAVAIGEPADAARETAARDAPQAVLVRDFAALLEMDLDGIVIATPSALHAQQAVAALDRGKAVFCQKPLGRTAEETRSVIAAARRADRLLGVDLSYRWTRGMQAVRDLVQRGELGAVYAADLVFHNGYGPDKPWFYDPVLAGGGCLMDLGVHLVDLALWTLGNPLVADVRGTLYAGGKLIANTPDVIEDHAIAELRLSTGATVRIACSWNLPTGADAIISAQFHGTMGGAAFRNVNGSFYDFESVRFTGTRIEKLTEPPDAWGGRAAAVWAERLTRDRAYDPGIEHVVQTAEVLDAVYGR